MLGIIVCTHSNFAAGLRDAVTMIAGEQENFDVVGFQEGEDMLALGGRVKALADKYAGAGDRYVVCVDLFGATPFNASAAALAEFDTSIVTGVNLPMLLQLAMERDFYEDYDEFLENVLSGAKDNMKVVRMREMFSQ